MTNILVIQARLNSTRLPGKVLMPLGGTSVLGQVIARGVRIPGIDKVCVAVPETASDDAVAAEAIRCGAEVFRGSETDVLGRYLGAARALGAKTVMRITSDCPIFDPRLSGAVLALLRESSVDYANNNMPASWPHGTETEVFTTEALARCDLPSTSAFEREHVTVLMRYRDDFTRANLLGEGGDWPAMRWTVDYPEDYAFMQRVFEASGPTGPDSVWSTLKLLEQHPEWAGLNRHHGHYSAEEPEVPSWRVGSWEPLCLHRV